MKTERRKEGVSGCVGGGSKVWSVDGNGSESGKVSSDLLRDDGP